MNYIENINKINGQLDKAREFRYFVLFSSFILFLDIALTCHNTPLLSLTYEQIKLSIKPGDILLFVCAYTFYLSFFIPLLKYIVRFIVLSEWMAKLFFSPIYYPGEKINKKNNLSLDDLKRFSLLNDNQVALEFYNKEKANIRSDEQLDFYCFSFIMADSTAKCITQSG